MDYYCCKCGREVDIENKPCVVDGERDVVAHLICEWERRYCSLCGRPFQEMITMGATNAPICEGHDDRDDNREAGGSGE